MSHTHYEIYPLPHDVTYHEGVTTLTQGLNVRFGNAIDEVTKNKVADVLKANDIDFTVASNAASTDGVTLTVASLDGDSTFDEAAVKALADNELDFAQIDAHQVAIADGAITVLGKDTDASFYGIVTLAAIIAQHDAGTVRNLMINDYANTQIRGVIEGYYGIPWSNEDRISLMEFGGQFKATSFVFAPKDDPYHREQWDELYPEDMLVELGKLADVGNRTKNRFVWTISPLGDVAKLARTSGEDAVMALLAENTRKMLAKFDQLYDVGVRQFGVLGDDVGNLPLDYVVQLMAAVSKWTDAKGDVYDTLYCPASYNSAWAWIPSELNAYEKGFADNIHIFWTGSTTCAPVVQSTIDVYKNKENDGLLRRDPLFWLNWPVNDVDMSGVYLGKGEMLEPHISNLAGVVTNPMQEAEASKISIFAIADYAWNTEDFNDQQSWEDSFKYVDPDAADELLVLATHMTDSHPHGIQVEESEALKPLLETITEKLEAGSPLAEQAEQVIAELEHIAEQADQFAAKTKNAKLKEELLPFNNALRDMVLADVAFIKAKLASEDVNHAQAWHDFSSGLSLWAQSNQHDRPMIIGEEFAKPAKKRLQPFTANLEAKVASQVADLLGIHKPVLEAHVFTNVADYETMTLNETLAVTELETGDVTLASGDYLGVKLSRVKDVTRIDAPAVDGLTLEVSLNGSEWTDVADGASYAEPARYVRLINHSADSRDFTLDTFKVTSHETEPKSVKETNYDEIDDPLALIDGNLATPAFFKGNQAKGKYITYDLGQEIMLDNLKAYVNESETDFPRHAILEASTDGDDWTTVMTFGHQDKANEGEEGDADRITEIFDNFIVPHRFKEESNLNVPARFLRFTVTRDKIGPVRWLRMQEIVINDGAYYTELNDPTITTDAHVAPGYETYHINDGDLMTSFKPGDTVAGSLLYHIGEVENQVTGLTILEDPRNLSGSTVSVRTAAGWTTLGKMTSAYQQFDTSNLTDIFDLKIEWAVDNVPTIHAIKIDRA